MDLFIFLSFSGKQSKPKMAKACLTSTFLYIKLWTCYGCNTSSMAGFCYVDDARRRKWSGSLFSQYQAGLHLVFLVSSDFSPKFTLVIIDVGGGTILEAEDWWGVAVTVFLRLHRLSVLYSTRFLMFIAREWERSAVRHTRYVFIQWISISTFMRTKITLLQWLRYWSDRDFVLPHLLLRCGDEVWYDIHWSQSLPESWPH